MRNFNFLKIFSAIAFAIFAGWSCWATTKSLALTLEDGTIPSWLLFAGVLGLFVLTSYCTKLVVDSCMQRYCDNRRVKFALGLIGVIFTWLLFSMPTNTHYFMYNKIAKDAAKEELTFIQHNINIDNKLSGIKAECEQEYSAIYQNFHAAFRAFSSEVDKYSNLGFGPDAQRKLFEALVVLDKVVDSDERNKFIEDVTKISGDYNIRGAARERTRFIEDCWKQIEEVYLKDLEKACMQPYDDAVKQQDSMRAQAKDIIADCASTIKALDTSENIEESLKESRRVITDAYSLVPELKAEYNGYPLKRATNVVEVWSDFLDGKFKDRDYGLVYWILLSIIIDLAAFAFFKLI